jgi:hypothetical protein
MQKLMRQLSSGRIPNLGGMGGGLRGMLER